MDKQRAKEIVSSLDMVDVTYKGSKIYIEDVNDTKETASIHMLTEPESSQEVDLNQLQES